MQLLSLRWQLGMEVVHSLGQKVGNFHKSAIHLRQTTTSIDQFDKVCPRWHNMMEHLGAGSTGNGRSQKLTHHHRINQCHWTPSQQSAVLDQVASCSVPKQMTFKGENKDHHNQNQGNHPTSIHLTNVHGQCHGDSEKRNPQRSAGTAAPAGRCWARGCSKPPTSYGCKNISHVGWLCPIYGTIQFMFHAL